MKTYEVLDHPADVGLKIYGATLRDLFFHAARGFADLVTDAGAFLSGQGGEAGASYSFSLSASSPEDLLHAWLRELLYVFSAKSLVLVEFDFEELNETGLRAKGRGDVFDPRRHEPKLEVKAVTRHQFYLRLREDGIWEAQVIFDV